MFQEYTAEEFTQMIMNLDSFNAVVLVHFDFDLLRLPGVTPHPDIYLNLISELVKECQRKNLPVFGITSYDIAACLCPALDGLNVLPNLFFKEPHRAISSVVYRTGIRREDLKVALAGRYYNCCVGGFGKRAFEIYEGPSVNRMQDVSPIAEKGGQCKVLREFCRELDYEILAGRK